MSKNFKPTGNLLALQLPVKIPKHLIEERLKDLLIGFPITSGDQSSWAVVKDIFFDIDNSQKLILDLVVQLKTKIRKDKILKIQLQADVQFDPKKQELQLRDYDIILQQESWISQQLIRSIIKKTINKKMGQPPVVSISQFTDSFRDKINAHLNDIIPVENKLMLYGSMEFAEISAIKFYANNIVVHLMVEGNLAVQMISLDAF
ncbi:DUF4403 family protein [uncultured Mesonia sp.]|uniref:DUF4403 family protein n=1 Tax=uncultured Mesonia sp. TaxID=399731 RepID=UPI00374FA4A2